MPDGELLRELRDPGREPPGVTHHHGPGRGGAALARGNEGREEDVVRCLFQVRVGEDQGCVLAAHLQRQQLRLSLIRPLDGLADAPTPGEQDRVDAGVRAERGAGRRPSLHEVEHAAGNAGLLHALGVDLRRVRRDLARLEHHRVAARQRRQDVPVGQVDGEVERPEHGSDAEGPEPALGARLSRRGEVRDQLEALIRGDAGFRAAGLRLQARFPERFADVEGDGASQILFALLEHRADPAHQPGTVVQRERRETHMRRPRRADRPVHLGHCPGKPAEHHREVRRRAILDDFVGRRGSGPASGDEVHHSKGIVCSRSPSSASRASTADWGRCTSASRNALRVRTARKRLRPRVRSTETRRSSMSPGDASAPGGSRCRPSLARRKRRIGSINSVGAEWCGPPSNGSIRSS